MRRDDVLMTLRPLRLLTVASAVLALALPAAGMAATGDVTTDRGVVQSVSVESGQIVLRALDGSVVSFAVSPSTRVKLNGVRVALADIQPGFVAGVVHDGAAPAVLIRAFGKPAKVTDRGAVTALTRSSITLQTADGVTVTIALDPSTQFRRLGLPAKRFLARPGALVGVTHAVDGPAKVVNIVKRARA
jgi:hypothetical protein